MKKTSDTKLIYAENAKEWRAWLAKNHNKEKKIGLIKYKKHTGKPSLTHKESMDEAICFGWIDTTIKRLDEDRYIRHFARRSKNSRWSYATLGYAKRLIKEKKMTPAGLHFYKEGLKKPTHDFGLSKNPEVPESLRKELEKNKQAKKNFNNFTLSYKRTYLRWIERAKRPGTKDKRIKEVVKMAVANQKYLFS